MFYAACTAGGIASCDLTHMAVTSLDLVNCNMQIDLAKYKSISSGFIVLLKEQSVKGFFRGCVPTLLEYSTQGDCKSGFYEFFNKYYSDMFGPEYVAKYKTLIYIVGAASAELIADIALRPMEAVPPNTARMLEWLFPYDMDPCKLDLQINAASLSASLDTLFDVSCDAMFGAEFLLLGKVLLFLNLRKTSSSLREEIILEFSRKLDDFLVALINTNLFSSVLGLEIPIIGALGPSSGIVWQPMYAFVLNTMKTFMIAASSSRLAWLEMETFLLQNLFSSPLSLFGDCYAAAVFSHMPC